VITRANPAFYHLLRLPAAALLGQSLSRFYLDPQRYAELRDVLHTQEIITHAESQLLCGDGTVAWISENGQIQRTGEGTIVGYFGTMIEITERKFAEETLKQEREKSEKILLNILPKPLSPS